MSVDPFIKISRGNRVIYSQVNADVLQQSQQRIQQDLLTALAAFSIPEPLKSAVHHAVMLGGKRVRPALCYATAALLPNHNFAAARRAVAIELIHCYSLAHDDLPCMDNDLLRRGQPTCHVAFGEDTALLAGDILQSMAFEILAAVCLMNKVKVQMQPLS